MEDLANELLFRIISRYTEKHHLNDFIQQFKLNINHRNEKYGGKTALHYAVDMCGIEVIKTLLINGADPNIKDNLGNTPLHDAVRLTWEECVKILLKHGADINSVNILGETPFLTSIVHQRYGMTKFLLNYNPDITITNIYGTSAERMMANKLMYQDMYIPFLKLLWSIEK